MRSTRIRDRARCLLARGQVGQGDEGELVPFGTAADALLSQRLGDPSLLRVEVSEWLLGLPVEACLAGRFRFLVTESEAHGVCGNRDNAEATLPDGHDFASRRHCVHASCELPHFRPLFCKQRKPE